MYPWEVPICIEIELHYVFIMLGWWKGMSHIRKSGTSLHFCASYALFVFLFFFCIYFWAVHGAYGCECGASFALSPRGHKYFVFVLKIKIHICKINFLPDSLCSWNLAVLISFWPGQHICISTEWMGSETVRDMSLSTRKVQDVHIWTAHLRSSPAYFCWPFKMS